MLKIIATGVHPCKGRGGAVKIIYNCDGCTKKCIRKVTFNSTVQVFQSRRLVTNLAIAVAFIVSGCMYSDMHRVMALGLGMHVLTEANFYNVIKVMYGPVCNLLNEKLEPAKTEMKLKPPQELGSWCRAITCSDGRVWLKHGHYSKNGIYTVRNYMTNNLLYVIHMCQCGKDTVIEEELYEGTSRAAEGYSTEEAFTQAHEGLKVAIHWQDTDSSAATAIKRVMPETHIMKCLGHV